MIQLNLNVKKDFSKKNCNGKLAYMEPLTESNAISYVFNAAIEVTASFFSQEVSVNERIITKYNATMGALMVLNDLILSIFIIDFLFFVD